MGDPLIADAAAALARGGVVVVPTETVYGLAVSPSDPGAVERLYALKGREPGKPLQVLVDGAAGIGRFGLPSEDADALAAAFWPGPLTLVVRAAPTAPASVVSDGTIGLRAPDHPAARALIDAAGPVAATSANRAGEPTPTDVASIRALFGTGVDVYLDGGRIEGSGSTVVDVTGAHPIVLREGPITADAVSRAVGKSI